MVKFRPYFERHYPRRERCIAILALVNFLLVFFDLSYLNLRNVYLRVVPELTRLYDPVKGIQPHPQTAHYLQQVDDFIFQVQASGFQSSGTEQLLAELRQSTQSWLESSSFTVSQSNLLEAIQQDLQSRTGTATAQEALAKFWSQDYLTQAGWAVETQFWQQRVRPLLQTMYYRRVDRFGYPINYFWLLDLPFVLIFASDLGARLWTIRRRFPALSWLDIGLRRWYDWLLLIPIWRWLRIVPVTLRLYHSDLLNLEAARAEIQRDAVITFGIELTEMLGIQIIEKMQTAIGQDDFFQNLFDPALPQPHGQIIYRQEVNAIADRLLSVSIHQVLPRLRPDIENLIQYTVASTIRQLPGYRQLQRIPGVRRLPVLLTQKLTNTLLHLGYSTIPTALTDSTSAEMATRLRQNLQIAFTEELRQRHYDRDIQFILIEVLERIKQNYVAAIVELEGRELIDKAEYLHKQIGQSNEFN